MRDGEGHGTLTGVTSCSSQPAVIALMACDLVEGELAYKRLGKVKGRVPSAQLCMRKSYVRGSPPPCWGKTFERAAALEVTQLPHTCSALGPVRLLIFQGDLWQN